MLCVFMQTRETDQTADAQADLSIYWEHMSEGTFFHITAPM